MISTRDLTDSFTISESENSSIDKLCFVRNCRTADFKALKLPRGRSGNKHPDAAASAAAAADAGSEGEKRRNKGEEIGGGEKIRFFLFSRKRLSCLLAC